MPQIPDRHPCPANLLVRHAAPSHQWVARRRPLLQRGQCRGTAARFGILAAPRMAAIHITDIEAAINWWRERSPSPDGITACPEVRALAEVYARLVYYREDEADEASLSEAARDAWLRWYAHTPDAPCIAICSTAPAEKRAVWRRITLQASAWRFNRYAERARTASGVDHPQTRPAARVKP